MSVRARHQAVHSCLGCIGLKETLLIVYCVWNYLCASCRHLLSCFLNVAIFWGNCEDENKQTFLVQQIKSLLCLVFFFIFFFKKKPAPWVYPEKATVAMGKLIQAVIKLHIFWTCFLPSWRLSGGLCEYANSVYMCSEDLEQANDHVPHSAAGV